MLSESSSGQAKKPVVKAEKRAKPGEAKAEQKQPVAKIRRRTRSPSRSASSDNAVKAEPVDASDDIDTAWLNEHADADCLDL